jgi:hypothetical protein
VTSNLESAENLALIRASHTRGALILDMEGAGEGGGASSKRVRKATKSVSGTGHVMPDKQPKRSSPGSGESNTERKRLPRLQRAAAAADAAAAASQPTTSLS